MFGILFNLVSFLAIRRMRHLLTPQILHEGVELNERRARHNKALTTIAFLPKIGLSYLLITGMMVGMSKSKGYIFKHYKSCRSLTERLSLFFFTAGQTVLQLSLWSQVLSPAHMFVLQLLILRYNAHVRSHIKRMLVISVHQMHQILLPVKYLEPIL